MSTSGGDPGAANRRPPAVRPDPAIAVVRTKPDQVADVNALVFASKAYWGYPDDLMELWRPWLTMTPEEVEARNAFHAEVGGEIAGMYVLDVRGDEAEIAALFVAPAHIRAGVGAALFRHAVALAVRAGAAYVLVESDPNAAGFYQRMGCRATGERASIPEGRKLPLLRLDV